MIVPSFFLVSSLFLFSPHTHFLSYSHTHSLSTSLPLSVFVHVLSLTGDRERGEQDDVSTVAGRVLARPALLQAVLQALADPLHRHPASVAAGDGHQDPEVGNNTALPVETQSRQLGMDWVFFTGFMSGSQVKIVRSDWLKGQ